MPKKDSLKKYRTRRDLKCSPEPSGTIKKPSKRNPIFVIQKHAASHVHYDIRIEYDGVFKSCTVPKGPSMNPSIKRLARAIEDHHMDYATFEGVIPAGSYGAGTVMVWDTGTYTNIKKHNDKLMPMKECISNRTIELFLVGEKLMGGFALIATPRGWLLIKMRDEYASARKNSVNTKNKSVLTGRCPL